MEIMRLCFTLSLGGRAVQPALSGPEQPDSPRGGVICDQNLARLLSSLDGLKTGSILCRLNPENLVGVSRRQLAKFLETDSADLGNALCSVTNHRGLIGTSPAVRVR